MKITAHGGSVKEFGFALVVFGSVFSAARYSPGRLLIQLRGLRVAFPNRQNLDQAHEDLLALKQRNEPGENYEHRLDLIERD